jgi:coniferyl-aldehyde dehydrogenase
MDQQGNAAPGTPETLLAQQRAAFMRAGFPTASQRQQNLLKLQTAVQQHQDVIADAISADFGNRSRAETVLSEILPVIAAAKHARSHLAAWMRPQRRTVGMNFKPATNRVTFTPKGVIGVVSPWNYPIYLTLGPLVDILAAGNRCMIKPSELTQATASLLAKLLGDIFPPDEVAVVQGDVAVGRAFAALPFDHLVFTGSTNVGRDIMRAAAENLVPVTLELGGKSPVIVAEDADIARAAKSIAVGKFFNAGQTCVSTTHSFPPRTPKHSATPSCPPPKPCTQPSPATPTTPPSFRTVTTPASPNSWPKPKKPAPPCCATKPPSAATSAISPPPWCSTRPSTPA